MSFGRDSPHHVVSITNGLGNTSHITCDVMCSGDCAHRRQRHLTHLMLQPMLGF